MTDKLWMRFDQLPYGNFVVQGYEGRVLWKSKDGIVCNEHAQMIAPAFKPGTMCRPFDHARDDIRNK